MVGFSSDGGSVGEWVEGEPLEMMETKVGGVSTISLFPLSSAPVCAWEGSEVKQRQGT